MTSTSFLDQMNKAGERVGGGGSGIVGRVLIEFGVHRYVQGHDFWQFFKAVSSPDDVDRVAQEVKGRLEKVGCTDAPNFGLRVTIFKDVLGRDMPYQKDLVEFTPMWQKDAYGLLMQHIGDASLPVGEAFYGHVQMKANPFNVKKGEAGKTDKDQNGVARFPTVRVPVKAFANEAEAQAFVGEGATGGSLAIEWSAKAQATYEGNLQALEDSTDEILKIYENAKKGIPMGEGYPLPQPLTPVTAKKYVADIYEIESSDIDLMVPF